MWFSCLFLTIVGVLGLLCPISATYMYTCFVQAGGSSIGNDCGTVAANMNYNGPMYCYHTSCLVDKGPMEAGCSLNLFEENGCPIVGTSSGTLYPITVVYVKAVYPYNPNYKSGFQTDSTGNRIVNLYPTAIPTPIPIAAPVPQPTVIPTAVPTSQPSSSPSSSPSSRPTSRPTSEPSAKPSSPPSSRPSSEPSSRPSSAPTVQPTAPTFAPTKEPTIRPTVTPTVIPTVTPTVVPTVIPTAVPTVVPTATPTARPTLVFQSRYVLAIGVKQAVSFLNTTDYALHQVSYNKTIQNTVASCVTGALASDVTDIVVQSNSGKTGGVRSLATPSTSLLSYKVNIRDPLVLMSMVTTQLQEAVSSGAMDAHLHQHAAQQGIEHLGNATFATPAVSSAADRDSSEQLTGAGIALVVIGAVMGVSLIATMSFFFFYHLKV